MRAARCVVHLLPQRLPDRPRRLPYLRLQTVADCLGQTALDLATAVPTIIGRDRRGILRILTQLPLELSLDVLRSGRNLAATRTKP